MKDIGCLKNYEKQAIYKNMKVNLTKAKKAGFYYEAIFIEYAIIEDRCTSLLQHAGLNLLKKNGYEFTISEKLNKLKGNPKFCEPFVRKRLSLEFLNRIEDWIKKRNRLIHALAKIPYDNEEIKRIAEDGNEIARLLDNATKSINSHREKEIL